MPWDTAAAGGAMLAAVDVDYRNALNSLPPPAPAPARPNIPACRTSHPSVQRLVPIAVVVGLLVGCEQRPQEGPVSTPRPAEPRAGPSATLSELPDEPATPARPSAPKPPPEELVALDQEAEPDRRQRDRRGRTDDGTAVGGGNEDGRQDPAAGPCPGGDPCPNGGYLIERCVTGGMAMRDEHGNVVANRSCSTVCAPAPPQGTPGMPCGLVGCRRFSCDGYAP